MRRLPKISPIFSSLATAMLAAAMLATAMPAASLSVIMYHRFGEDEYPSTNTTGEQLAEHIELLKQRRVLPLAEAIRRLRAGERLADAVAITVDDAFLSFYENGLPSFVAADLPLTLFVSADSVGKGGYMGIEALKEAMASGLVAIGNHGASHSSFIGLGEAEIKAELEESQSFFAERLGVVPTLFSYPYGEAGEREIQLLGESGFQAAFGQHSGAIGVDSEWFYLPRFALNERYGTRRRVVTALDAKPLALRLSAPRQPASPFGEITLRILRAKDGEGLTCFSGGKRVKMSRDGEVLRLHLAKPFASGRNRINCTKKKDGGWGWFGWQFAIGGEGRP